MNFLNSTTSDDLGQAIISGYFPPSDSDYFNNAFIGQVYASPYGTAIDVARSGLVAAHELGHILGLYAPGVAHSGDKWNLMTPILKDTGITGSKRLDTGEATIIQSSPLLGP